MRRSVVKVGRSVVRVGWSVVRIGRSGIGIGRSGIRIGRPGIGMLRICQRTFTGPRRKTSTFLAASGPGLRSRPERLGLWFKL